MPAEVGREIMRKVQELGFYAPNIPEEFGGGGLDHLTFTLLERELGRASYALSVFWGRPSNILCGCNEEQRERYLLPAVRGERIDCLAMTEPEAGSDVRSMKTTARRDGGDWVIDGTKHFISHADLADFAIVFVATGTEETRAGTKQRITCFLVDRGTPGFEIRPGYKSVSHRGYHNCILNFDGCRVPDAQILGEEGTGFELMNTWLYATRLTVAATSVGRARRVFDLAADWAASRKQFGQPIGKFQGTSFKLADMATEIDAADLLTLNGAWMLDQGLDANRMIAQAKLFATEMLARVTDNAIQIFGGMGLMEETGIERFWRDARVERIWDGTSPRSSATSSAATSCASSGPELDLRRLLQPRSIAVFGGWQAEGVIRRCAEMGFAGPVWAGASRARPGALRSVAELPEAPDAAFVAVNREATVGIVRELAAMGAGGAVCHAAGFSESGGRGVELQAALIEAAGEMPILGPNCYGTINYLDGALLWFDQHGGRRCERGVAILTQSGNIGLNLTMQRRGLPIGHLMTLGNQAKVGLSDCLAALVDDPRVTAIGLHIEAIDDVAKFDAAARKALAAKKPVVAVKAGRSEARCRADAEPHRLARRRRRRHGRAAAPGRGRSRGFAADPAGDAEAPAHRGPAAGPRPGHAQLLGRRGGADRGCRRSPPGALSPVRARRGRSRRRDAERPRHHLQPARLPHLHLEPARAPARHLHRGHGLRLGPRLPRPRLSSHRQLQRRRLAGLARRLAGGARRHRGPGRRAGDPAGLPARGRGRGAARGRDRAAARHRRGARRCRGRGGHRRRAGQVSRRRRCLRLPPPARRARHARRVGRQAACWRAHGLPHPGGRLVAPPPEAVAAARRHGLSRSWSRRSAADLAHKSELGAVALGLRDAGAVEAPPRACWASARRSWSSR